MTSHFALAEFASLNWCNSVIIRYAQPIPCFMNHSVFRVAARIQKSRHTKFLGASAFHLPKINLIQHVLTADLIKPQVSQGHGLAGVVQLFWCQRWSNQHPKYCHLTRFVLGWPCLQTFGWLFRYRYQLLFEHDLFRSVYRDACHLRDRQTAYSASLKLPRHNCAFDHRPSAANVWL